MQKFAPNFPRRGGPTMVWFRTAAKGRLHTVSDCRSVGPVIPHHLTPGCAMLESGKMARLRMFLVLPGGERFL